MLTRYVQLEALSLCLMMMALIAATAAVWGLVLCCLALCCSRPAVYFTPSNTLSHIPHSPLSSHQIRYRSVCCMHCGAVRRRAAPYDTATQRISVERTFPVRLHHYMTNSRTEVTELV